jgi:uncharacterized membrane protein
MTIKKWRAMPWFGAGLGAIIAIALYLPFAIASFRDSAPKEQVPGETSGMLTVIGIIVLVVLTGIGATVSVVVRGSNPED